MNKSSPLIIEHYPDDYHGYKFITLIRYNDENTLNIVDNVINNQINAYVLDLCTAMGVNEEVLINIVHEWYINRKDIHPISIEFSKLGLAADVAKIIRCYPIDYVTRVIGPLPEYKMSGVYKIRKRKKKDVPKDMEVIEKLLPLLE